MAHEAKKLTSKVPDDAFDIANAKLVRRGPARSAQLSLRTLREGARLTQQQVSKKSGLAQSEISKIEAAGSVDDRMVSTVRRYLAAIGADLDLVAVSKFGHRIGVAGANTEHDAVDESPITRLREHIAAAANVLEEVEPFREGINVDNRGQRLQDTLRAVVDAAAVRWKEAPCRRRYMLPAALLHLAATAFRDEGVQNNDGLAKDIAATLKAIAAAWERGDQTALSKPSAKGRRDAPMRWVAKYEGRPATLSERARDLIVILQARFARDPESRTVQTVVSEAILSGCIEADPLELWSKLAKHVQRNGWPDDVQDLVGQLVKFATGKRDPLNTINKRQRRRDLGAG